MRGASVWAGVCATIGLGLVLSVSIGVYEGSSAARAVEVGGVDMIGDDEADRFVGSGAVFLPSTVSADRRQQAAWCHGCRWKVTTPCLREDEHSDAGCRGSVLGCTQGRGDRSSLACSPRCRFRAGGVVLSPRRGGDVGRGHEYSHPR